jgi:hypothetical protein
VTYHLRIEGPDGAIEQDFPTYSDAVCAIWRPLWKAGRSIGGSQQFAESVDLDGTPATYGARTFTLQGPPVCGETEFADPIQYPHVCRLSVDHAGDHECVCTPVIKHCWSP